MLTPAAGSPLTVTRPSTGDVSVVFETHPAQARSTATTAPALNAFRLLEGSSMELTSEVRQADVRHTGVRQAAFTFYIGRQLLEGQWN